MNSETVAGAPSLRLAGRAAIASLLFAVLAGSSCGADGAPLLPADTTGPPGGPGAELMARWVHVTDTHIVDAASPARFAGADVLIPFAWRAWENSSTQLLDGIIRTVNRLHASGERIDFLLHTGDACDNAQSNELNWFIAVMDGKSFTPLSGPDDRPPGAISPNLDPYAAFVPQGLYCTGVHGPLPSIPWYAAIGNHDAFAIGVFPVITRGDGSRVAPLPLPARPGVFLPTVLDPTGAWTYGLVTPACPGPPPLLSLPHRITPVPDRRYFTKGEFPEAMFSTMSGPPGHGLPSPAGPARYSVSPVPGLRLITLDTADVSDPAPGWPYDRGCISPEGRDFLRAELDAAGHRGEWVIVATHHPSGSLEVLYGSALGPGDFRELLNQYPNVLVHLAGHTHRNRVADRGGYIEIETCSTLDWPQEARVVEIWKNAEGALAVAYRMISGFDDSLPPLGDDPLRAIREQAHALAMPEKSDENMWRPLEPSNTLPEGDLADREGIWRKIQ